MSGTCIDDIKALGSLPPFMVGGYQQTNLNSASHTNKMTYKNYARQSLYTFCKSGNSYMNGSCSNYLATFALDAVYQQVSIFTAP